MSGHAFKDKNPHPVTYDNWIVLKSILCELFPRIEEIGSSQHQFKEGKGMYTACLGDLDFAVEMSKKDIIEIIHDNPEVFQHHRIFGNTISTLVFNPEDEILQHVDLMPSTNVEDEAWIMSGGSSEIKGVMRNILLSYMARLRSEADTIINMRETKWTVAFPGGIGYSYDGNKITSRTTDPKAILSKLILRSDKEAINKAKTFEGLCSLIYWDKKMILGFEEYSKKQWLYKKQPSVIEKALNYVNENYNQQAEA